MEGGVARADRARPHWRPPAPRVKTLWGAPAPTQQTHGVQRSRGPARAEWLTSLLGVPFLLCEVTRLY